MDVSKTIQHIQIKINMPNPSQEPPASSKAPNKDLKDIDVLCTFKIKIESLNLDHMCIKDQRTYPNLNQDVKPQSGASSILQSPESRLKGYGCPLNLQNQDREPTFVLWVYQRQVTIFKPRSRCQIPGRNLMCPRNSQSELKGHRYSLHIQN